jgi:two-component sensor histidine kinase
VEGEIVTATGERARSQCIPVRWRGAMLGILSRESAPSVGRRPGELERVYVEIFDRLARMIAAGTFPFPAEDAEIEEAPRVGDGVLLLDDRQVVVYASPNAISGLHRAGIHANAFGARLEEIAFEDSAVRTAMASRMPVTEEFDAASDVTLLVRCIPLLEHDRVTGAVVLMRDISELRRRDRLLVSKDATIREIHHRVKNNLQTISSLLRLQGRRLASPEAKDAIEESVRRIRSIALVHETLARGAGEDVDFTGVVRPLVRTVGEGLASPDRPVHFRVEGDAGQLPAEVATPLSVVLRSCCRTRSTTPSRRTGRATSASSSSGTTRSWWSGCTTTGWGCRSGSRSSSRRAWACRSCGTSS